MLISGVGSLFPLDINSHFPYRGESLYLLSVVRLVCRGSPATPLKFLCLSKAPAVQVKKSSALASLSGGIGKLKPTFSVA